MATLSELQGRLASVQAAISAIESGSQSVASKDGGTMSRGDLRTLYLQESQIEKRIAKISRGGGIRLVDIS